MRDTFQTYYQLTKPGIIYGNAVSLIAGLLLASIITHTFDVVALLGAIIGTSVIIGASCVFNNYIDRDIDRKMKRTKDRAIVSGRVSGRGAIAYGSVLMIIGFLVLWLTTNFLTVIVGIVGVIFYVVIYGYFKRNSVHGTEVGSIAGAIPPVAGYTAITGQYDAGAIILFLILVFWQMPHFYAIAMYRKKEYAAAGIPVLPAVRGMKVTKQYIMAYIVVFLLVTPFLTIFGYTGYIYVALVLIIGLWWLYKGIKTFRTLDDVAWGRKMFFSSLTVLLAVSAAIPLGAILP